MLALDLVSVLALRGHVRALPPGANMLRLGVRIVVCEDIVEAHARLHETPAALCAVDATCLPGETALFMAHLRARAPSGILAITRDDCVESRIQALLLGADICVSQGATQQEFAAAALAVWRRLRRPAPTTNVQARRYTPPTGENARGWRWVNEGRRLVAPNGASMALTESERRLLGALATAAGKTVSRHAIGAALGQGRPVNHGSISMTVSRLRSKARQAGVELPLTSLVGSGYALRCELDHHTADALGGRADGPNPQAPRSERNGPDSRNARKRRDVW